MAFEIDPREFGEMSANVKTLLAHQETIRSDLVRHQAEIRSELASSNTILFRKIDALSDDVAALQLDGCALGRQHEGALNDVREQVKEIKARPERFVSIGAGIVAVLSAVYAWMHGGTGT